MQNSTRRTAEEIARIGDEIYEQQIRAQLEPGQNGKIVAIDVNTGSYAVSETALSASRQVLSQQPDADIWLVRVGHRALHRIGIRPARGQA